MSLIVGLTGSIGMGKSATAKLFAEAGLPTWDADAAVHRLYAPGGAGTRALGDLYPTAIGPDGVDRTALKDLIAADPQVLKELEARIHPLVAEDRVAFLAEHRDADIVVLDIPLLFEAGLSDSVDVIVVVSTDAETQRRRVLDRPNMTEAQFAHILAQQLPDAEKRARADHVIFTDTPEHAYAQVRDLIAHLRTAPHA